MKKTRMVQSLNECGKTIEMLQEANSMQKMEILALKTAREQWEASCKKLTELARHWQERAEQNEQIATAESSRAFDLETALNELRAKVKRLKTLKPARQRK